MNIELTEDFAWTLGVIAGRGNLYADIPARAWDAFREKYIRITGLVPDPQKREQIYLRSPNLRSKKFGANLMIRLPFLLAASSRLAIKHHVCVRGRAEINDNELWWDLVENYGFRLGGQPPMDIANRLPENLQPSFWEGRKE